MMRRETGVMGQKGGTGERAILASRALLSSAPYAIGSGCRQSLLVGRILDNLDLECLEAIPLR